MEHHGISYEPKEINGNLRKSKDLTVEAICNVSCKAQAQRGPSATNRHSQQNYYALSMRGWLWEGKGVNLEILGLGIDAHKLPLAPACPSISNHMPALGQCIILNISREYTRASRNITNYIGKTLTIVEYNWTLRHIIQHCGASWDIMGYRGMSQNIVEYYRTLRDKMANHWISLNMIWDVWIL